MPVSDRRVPCESCPLRALPHFRPFTAGELKFVSTFKQGELAAAAGTTILAEGAHSAHLFSLLSGWAFRYKALPDGRRQILNYALPADLVGLQGSLMDETEHSVEALTDVRLCVFPRERLWDLYSKFPSLAFDVTWLAAREEQLLDEHLLAIGQRSALERTAYVLLLLFMRAQEVGLASANSVQFPFTQQHLADTLGMSLVHTNKTLKRLYAAGAVRWRDRVFEIIDREALVKIAGGDVSQPRKRPFI